MYLSFFEVFSLVFSRMYGFNLGEVGLPFISCQVGVDLGATP
jgi:DHA1 family multidrug resistance protein-like MFS transporter